MNTYVTGITIRQLREKQHLTQLELAERIGVSSKTVSKWETGKGLPDISLLQPLAQALGISLIELVNGEHIINRNTAANLPPLRQYHPQHRQRRRQLLRHHPAPAGGGRCGR